ncbi:MAG TPA: heavy metal-binding domain-containing protein [Polyangiaceae bacterium]|nr:heavy metal-binding domain-containing protein [Polyangiaceae bacterium]
MRVVAVTGRAAALVVAARALLFLAALSLVGLSLRMTVRSESAGGATAERFSCPMHPEVTSTEAGECPICKMALERVGREGKRTGSSASCESVQPRLPTRAGATAPDAPLQGPASPLGRTWLPETFPASRPGRTSDGPALATPRWKTTNDAVRAPAWVETADRLSALLYRDELVGLRSRERGIFFRALTPRTPIAVELDDESPKRWDASTVLVHFVFTRPKGDRGAKEPEPWRTGDVGFLELEPRSRDLLLVPESAILRSGNGSHVLVAESDETFTRRPVELGRARKGFAVVVGGLGETDRVVVGNAFFFDARRAPESVVEAVAGVGP